MKKISGIYRTWKNYNYPVSKYLNFPNRTSQILADLPQIARALGIGPDTKILSYHELQSAAEGNRYSSEQPYKIVILPR